MAKYEVMRTNEQEDLAQSEKEGKALVKIDLNETLFKWLKEEWPSVNRPVNYKQRAIAAQVSAAIDAVKKE
jgi:dsDNA-binding SOS-regulon protein